MTIAEAMGHTLPQLEALAAARRRVRAREQLATLNIMLAAVGAPLAREYGEHAQRMARALAKELE